MRKSILTSAVLFALTTSASFVQAGPFTWNGEEIIANEEGLDLTNQSVVAEGGVINAHVNGLTITTPAYTAGGILSNVSPFKGTHIANSVFENNVANVGIGSTVLLAVQGDESITHRIENSTFRNNKTQQLGGALQAMHEGILQQDAQSRLFIDGSTFEGNSSEKDGGAIWVDPYNTTISSSTFEKNKAIGNGGAISFNTHNGAAHAPTAKLLTSNFVGNSANGNGGAIHADSTQLSISGSEFKGNKSTYGGAIFATKGSVITVENSTFENNQAQSVGGAIATGTTSGKASVKNSIFKNNHSVGDGGAIGNYSAMSISGSLFEGNTAQLDFNKENNSWTEPVKDDLAIGGGAISLGAVSDTEVASIQDTTFKNNVSGTNGGAVATRLGAHADNSKAKLEISATFIGNEAKLDGGAFYNTFYAGEGVKVSGVFTDNLAGKNGGAIYNDGAIDKAGNAGGVMVLSDSHFSGNKAGELGGAIYNSGTLTLSGNNVFENNTDKNGFNDIYNAGTLKVISGTTTLNSGLNGTDNSKVDLAKEATLAVGGQTSIAMLSGQEGATLSVLSTEVEVKKNEIQNLKLTASGDVNDKLKGDAQALTKMVGKGEKGPPLDNLNASHGVS